MKHGGLALSGLALGAFVLSACTSSSDDEPASATSTPATTASETPRPAPTFPPGLVQARVIRVIDGDTVEVDVALDGRKTVRYIGIDAPESVTPNEPAGCYGREASERNRALVEGKTVYLERDVSETDRFGRTLRYVYLEDARMVNEVLLEEGFAESVAFSPDVKHQAILNAAQGVAQASDKGLWGACRMIAPAATPR